MSIPLQNTEYSDNNLHEQHKSKFFNQLTTKHKLTCKSIKLLEPKLEEYELQEEQEKQRKKKHLDFLDILLEARVTFVDVLCAIFKLKFSAHKLNMYAILKTRTHALTRSSPTLVWSPCFHFRMKLAMDSWTRRLWMKWQLSCLLDTTRPPVVPPHCCCCCCCCYCRSFCCRYL